MSKLELNKGTEILSAIGGIETIEQARALLAEKLDAENLGKLGTIRHDQVLLKIANAIALGQPDKVFVNTGSAEDLQWVRNKALEKGEEAPLAMKDHTIHFDLPQEQGRIIDRTFYIVNDGEPTNALASTLPRQEALEYVVQNMSGMMKGMTLIVGFYARGPVGALATVPALEITTSAYVSHSAEILYRNCFDKLDQEIDRRGYFYTNFHCEGANRPEDLPNARVFMDRSWLTTFSVFCTYAGNTLLLKKGNHRFSIDMATYYQRGRELSEHMFITGLRGPNDRITFFAGAAPSGCGKTTTAMVGTDFIGDDLAQMWIAEDGTMRGVNPENGIFGIVKDVNRDGDPLLMTTLREQGAEVIWSNVLVDDAKVPHWEGNGEEHPKSGRNFQGDWSEGKLDANSKPVPISHPNARCTVRNTAIENFNDEWAQNKAGVPVKVVTYSGRDSDTMPPIWVAKNPDEGVILGASIVSAATATEVGATGVRRQPWANAPFIPGRLGDYMYAQLEFFNSKDFTDEGQPILAGLNYFLTHASRGSDGKGLLGEKRDVKPWLSWLERRAHGEVEAIETPIGFIPLYEDLQALFKSTIEKEYPRDLYDMQFSFYVDNIIGRIEMQKEAYGKEQNIPPTLFEVYDRQIEQLGALREKFGSIITPEQLKQAATA
jgi:phosphoenolpyruvate carboxykinase (GTP)